MRNNPLSTLPIAVLIVIILHQAQSYSLVPNSKCNQKYNLVIRNAVQVRRKISSNLNMTSNGNFLISNINQLTNDGPKRLILASQSPRRREILDMMGLKEKYTTCPSPLNEEELQIKLSKTDLCPEKYTQILAEEKANALAQQIVATNSDHEVTFILGSDTIVALNGNILEKPKDHENAVEMLSRLSGEWHDVHTGVALYRIDHSKTSTDSDRLQLAVSYTETSRVKFASLSKNDIEAYVNTGEPMDKAGAYGIQGIGGQFVERMEGDFFTVMGLPMHSLSREITKALSSI